jgi:DNA mismatch repair protein MutL
MIRVLDQNTIDKIAAGEVIEKPGSVVKELVENSIDSGATAITVEIKDGGLSFIRITDNGCGIPKDEVPTAFLRHATSKLVSAEDLVALSSLGFRGEALSSIAAIAQVELITKTNADITGTRYQISGGREISNEEIGCPSGTTIIVRNMFFNTPARKKFMKTPATEGSYIYDLVCRICMSHPEISFKFIMNGSDKLYTTGNGKLKDIIYHIYGRDITANLIEVNAETDNLKMTGFIAKPIISRGNRSFEDYYVNSRYIKSNIVTKAIEDAYRTFVMVHKFPFTVLNFQISPDLIDVNIHPQKMELKFMNGPDVYDFIYNNIRETLLLNELIPNVSPGKQDRPETLAKRHVDKKPEPFEMKRKAQEENSNKISKENVNSSKISNENSDRTELKKDSLLNGNHASRENIAVSRENSNILRDDSGRNSYNAIELPFKDIDNLPVAEALEKSGAAFNNTVTESKKQVLENTTPPAGEKSISTASPVEEAVQLKMFDDKFLGEQARAKHRLIGQLFKTYWLIEYDNKLFIMDQHAAHEKVKFEELMNNYKNKKICTQYLMPPAIVTLSGAEIEFLKENMDMFNDLGYQLEAFGGREYKLTCVPDNLFGLDGRDLFLEFIGELTEENKKSTIDIFISKLSTMACKAAIKGNTSISFEEADQLIDQLLKLENPYTCPHGRPTLISMSEEEIEKKFKRIV